MKSVNHSIKFNFITLLDFFTQNFFLLFVFKLLHLSLFFCCAYMMCIFYAAKEQWNYYDIIRWSHLNECKCHKNANEWFNVRKFFQASHTFFSYNICLSVCAIPKDAFNSDQQLFKFHSTKIYWRYLEF